MTLIFIGSTNTLSSSHTSRFLVPFLRWLHPEIGRATLDTIQFFIRKAGHLSEYGLLALLLWRAFRQPFRGDARPWDRGLAGRVILLAALYAASDEFHQSFYSSRESSVRDVVIDTAGASIALFILWALGRWRKHW